MKIACIAVPHPHEYTATAVPPPLPLGYLAAVLEQRRHIVRVYDLALTGGAFCERTRMALAAFRPHLVLIAGGHDASASAARQLLPDAAASTVRVATELREQTPAQAAAQAIWQVEGGHARRSDESVIVEALRALDDDLDSLPFPARHLLPIEHYQICTPDGELQTPVLLAQRSGGRVLPRAPQQVLAEVQSIMREHGIRHFAFPQAPIEQHREWLYDLLYHLASADLGPCWELHMRPVQLPLEWLPLFRRAGCEMICIELPADAALHQCDQRAEFTELVERARRVGIRVRARIALDAPSSKVTALIDVLATFNLDAVQLQLGHGCGQPQPGDGTTAAEVAELARRRYRARRGRQLFVNRFGPQLGPMLWQVGRSGLLGTTWHRDATGGEARVLVS